MDYFASNYAWLRYWYVTAITNWPGSLPMFLFGLYLGRRRFFENSNGHRRELWGALISGLTLGAVAYGCRELLLTSWSNRLSDFVPRVTSGLLWTIHGWGLAAFYGSTLLLLLHKPLWRRRLAHLGVVGRMALTNYLLQASLIVPGCIAFGLFDRVTPSIGLLLALGVWTLQVPASVWWLRHFRFGPAEWLWRSLTYGKSQPMGVATERRLCSVQDATT